MTEYIQKTSGFPERYDEAKVIQSLRAVGARDNTIQDILDELRVQYPHITNSEQIFNIALEKLKALNTGLASRYNLKKALLALGPAGYPFEQYVAEIFKAQGYDVKTNIVAQGYCVAHELDVIAVKDGTLNMIECKFHNNQQYTSDVKVPLYIKARYDDLLKAELALRNDHHKHHKAWVVTNTTFTADAVQYAQCAGITPLSWNFPEGKALKDLIDTYKLHPITALVSLSEAQRNVLLKHNIVLCRDAAKGREALQSIGTAPATIELLLKEAETTCTL
jgi:hypothetical protein